ncbi:MAG TPA: UvrD-helicase domain-containing protein [Armatimonadota bacterium]|nr:UvrD-helicase domain-containing protein [Armatimonadota bacterium]
MTFIADLHIHSRYSRATSRELCFEQLYAWGRRKGLSLIGTGDCTHPAWLTEITEKLIPDGDGVFRLNDDLLPAVDLPPMMHGNDVRFLITGEISTIYKADGATRKVHHLVCLPSIEAAKCFADKLARVGNIASDGRPILGLNSRDLLEILLEASPDSVLIPAHIWTPWFSVLGSKSGFDSVADCYGDLADHIFAVETGLSSDPPMNWMVSNLDRYTLVSNSDAHSPAKLGREANIFTCDVSYTEVMRALRRETAGFWGTLEFFPEEGKYHYDGHRKCDFTCTPEESKELHGKCPVCGGPLTLGVEYRVTELADRPRGIVPEGAFQYQSLLSLAEIIAEVNNVSATSKKVMREYDRLLAEVGAELYLLREAEIDEIKASGGELLARAIVKMRSGKVHTTPGYDGEYGIIKVFNDEERAEVLGQIQLFAGLSFASVTPRQQREAASTPVAQTAAIDETTTDNEDGLSNEQQTAVEYPPSPLVIVAGPGAGKTRTLVERIAHMVSQRDITPSSILAITFSNRAAREMAERVSSRLASLNHAEHPTVATFHKLGFTIINEYADLLGLRQPVKILAEDEADELFRQSLAESEEPCDIKNLDEVEQALTTVYSEASGTPASLHALAERAQQIAPAYTAAKRQRGALDFTDLLILPLILLAEHDDIRTQLQQRWQHVFVDEYQDVNVFQYLLLRLLCPPQGDLCVIGDPDQAIYGFRGADVRYFLRFQQDYPDAGMVALARNYRSSDTIVKASSQVIAQGSTLQQRKLWSSIRGPEHVDVAGLPTPQAEAEFVIKSIESLLGGISHFSVDSGRSGDGVGNNLGFNDIAVLYRTHTIGEELQEAFERSGIPYQRAARRDIFHRADIRRTIALLTIAQQPSDRTAIATLLKLGVPGIPKEVAQRLARRIGWLRSEGVPIIDFLLQSGILSPEEGDALNKIHDGIQSIVDADDDTITPMRAILQACLFFGINEDTLEENHWLTVRKHAERAEDVPTFLRNITLERDMDIYDPRAARVTLMTVHAAKGLEWDTVFMIGCEEGCFPHPASTEDEERRLFYVGMTRARQHLFLSHVAARTQQGEHVERNISPFIHDIDRRLISTTTPFDKRPRRPKQTQLALTDLFGA